MDPQRYVRAYLERTYRADHPDLTEAAQKLLHDDVAKRPEHYAQTDFARALISYARTHEHLMDALARMDDLPDEEFERKRAKLFDQTRHAMHEIAQAEPQVIDAQLVGAMLTDQGLDACLSDLMKIEAYARERLETCVAGFDEEAPHFWKPDLLAETGCSAAELTRTEPALVGWLHALEAISQLSLASARYRAAARYARTVMRAVGYPNHAEGTVLLSLARLEDSDGFFALVHELEQRHAQAAAEGYVEDPLLHGVDDSPWFLLARTLLLYKEGKERPARRALREFSQQCDGGAFLLLNPTYINPYLPVRPTVHDRWKLVHQAVWEAEGAVYDTPDFVPWAETVEGIFEASEGFAERHGF